MILLPITKQQKQIPKFLYRFRFLNTNQIQKLMGHKLPTRIQAWLKNLKDKGYIGTNYKRKTFEEGNKPVIYYLKPKVRKILENEENFNLNLFNSRIYKEHQRGEKFVNHCIFVADMFLFFLSKKEKKEDLQFFTKTDLVDYDYFPDTELDGYIVVKNGKKTTRYFLNIFDPYTPAFVYRNIFKKYSDYAKSKKWENSTGNTPLPLVLFVCHSDNMQKHIYFHAKAKFEKQANNKISLFLTTRDTIQFAKNNTDIWQKVD